MIWAISGTAIAVMLFLFWIIRKSRQDGANENLSETAVQHSEEIREINEMENQIDEDSEKKRPRTSDAIRDFFKRGG